MPHEGKGSISIDLAGVELRLLLERVTDHTLPRDLSGKIPIDELGLQDGHEHPLFLTARQRDHSRVWTSPMFVTVR
ncbi:hypothetical protein [Rhizobium leguminosarum]|uniref:hypothetical protein n=1 Tax=Rhizobium leguminosarum TaxID=384 RepID=UPI0003101891|nr:hypothetical protein [Rhizobium leguminosarum]